MAVGPVGALTLPSHAGVPPCNPPPPCPGHHTYTQLQIQTPENLQKTKEEKKKEAEAKLWPKSDIAIDVGKCGGARTVKVFSGLYGAPLTLTGLWPRAKGVFGRLFFVSGSQSLHQYFVAPATLSRYLAWLPRPLHPQRMWMRVDARTESRSTGQDPLPQNTHAGPWDIRLICRITPELVGGFSWIFRSRPFFPGVLLPCPVPHVR